MTVSPRNPALPDRHVHFVGIGGIGMSGIAQVMNELGYAVSGSDAKASPMLETLAGQGIQCHVGHHPDYIRDADCLVATSAVSTGNPEIAAAIAHGIPVVPRAKMLGCLMNSSRGIAVAGTHGKTSISAMIATLLTHAGIDPTVVVGGHIHELGGSNARVGLGEWFVAEADESDGSLVELSPEIAILNNIDTDHLDHYGSVQQLTNTFSTFLSKVPADGAIFLAIDDPRCLDLARFFARQVITYGVEQPADFRVTEVHEEAFASEFLVEHRGKRFGEFRLNRPGRHNVSNALAAIAVAHYVGLDREAIRTGLAAFRGVKRRFDILHACERMIVVDDYAHHPAEIAATVQAARTSHRDRIIGIFQPHRYSRVQLLHEEFGPSLAGLDEVILTDIYAAGESPVAGVDHRLLLESIARTPGSPSVRYMPVLEDIPAYIHARTRPRDLVLTLGAGDVRKVAEELAATVG